MKIPATDVQNFTGQANAGQDYNDILAITYGFPTVDDQSHFGSVAYTLQINLNNKGFQVMIEVKEMANTEIDELLERVGYGHFACSRNDRPYVVPIHYAYQKPDIYIYTTEGLKTDIIRSNPHVCLQVEEVMDNDDWRSVIVEGDVEQITARDEREEVIKLIRSTNPALTPAISIRWLDNWIRENVEVVYRIKPRVVTGRSSVKVKISAAFARSGNERSQK